LLGGEEGGEENEEEGAHLGRAVISKQ
jgi:hypothetical protein